MARELTSDEKGVMELIRQAENIALFVTEYDGREVPVIVAVWEDENNSAAVAPLGMLFDDTDFDKLKAPDGTIGTGVTGKDNLGDTLG